MASCSETMRQCHPHHQYLLFLMMTTGTLLLTISMAAPSHESSSLQRQASILLDIKQGFEFPTPTLDSWNLSNYKSLCSSWTGVQCDSHSVVSLDISNLNLSGTVSPSIAQLTSLQTLSLANNNFSGQFPSEILHNLSNLQFLNVSTNQFTGELSSSWKGMNNLLSLDIYDNNFDGSLPLSILNLTNLYYLDLSGNFFSGSIPSAYGKMESLTYLSLAGNDLNGTIPSHLGNLRNLTQLRLGYYNSFSGGIPVEFGNLTNLTHLDLANCGLTGPIPAELGQLHNLDTLFLQFNQLTGSLPKELGSLTALRFFDVSNNLLTGEIPTELSGLSEMTVMNLFMNKFHGQIPGFVAEWRELRVLQLWRNNFTGSIPRKLGRNGKVEEVDLSSNKLTGLVPEWLCYGGKLRILILLNNFVFGSLPNSLGRCESLVRVRLGQNYLSGDIPNGLLYLPNLSFLELQDNYLTGGIGHQSTGKPLSSSSSSSGSGSKLTLLNLSNNRLSGPLPDSIGNLSSLKTVLLSGNNFSGEIPSRIGELRDMIKLDLSRNNLSSRIPPELGECSELSSLELSQNQFYGPIPVQLSRIKVLGYLNVSWNKLNGQLSSEIGSMKSLTSADFSHNNFSGSVPETGQFPLFMNSTCFDGNPFLCGFPSKPCSGTQTSTTTLDHQLHTTKSPLLLSGRVKLVFALGLFIFSLLFAIFAINKTKKIWRNTSSNSWKLTSFQTLTFRTEHILQSLTDGNIIGKGGAGIVYRGITPTGEYIAVKKLFTTTTTNTSKKKCYHNDHGLSAEIQTLGKIRHRNIVRLLAFCTNKETKTNLLVYEYMPNGSLGEILHGGGKTLKWEIRLKIAIEAAKGLCYLHHDCDPLIIHRDVKANNILISDEYEAHVADFGLAKFLQQGNGNGGTECMSAIAGSYGYIAPEYAYTLKVDEKSDVYSFGVVLLELITGRRPVGDFGEEGLLDIVQWSKMQTGWNKEKVVNIIDKKLQQQDEVVVPVPVDEAAQVFFVAMLCVQEHSIERPTMREVVQMLVQAKQRDAFGMH